MTKHFAGLTISALLLAGATHSWAGPGDFDPSFGAEGSLGVWRPFLLPDDRLISGHQLHSANTDYSVQRFDANGKVDPSFGGLGESHIALPDAWPYFYAAYASATLDGGVLLAGTLHGTGGTLGFDAVLRLDRDGKLVTAFGGQSDGLYRLTDAPFRDVERGTPTILMAMVVDSSGRVLLAERSWTADGRCGGPTSVVRLTSSGTPDATFGTNGRAAIPGIDLCGGAALFGARSDGSIVVGARGAIVGLDAAGALDLTFGVDGHVLFQLRDVFGRVIDDWTRGALLPDGSILIVQHSPVTWEDPYTVNSNSTVFTKLDRTGQDEASSWIDLAALFSYSSDKFQLVQDFVLAPDNEHVYVQLEVQPGNLAQGRWRTGCIARVSVDGTPDFSFGRQGLTCLDYGAFPYFLLGSQRNGALLFGARNSTGLYRLLADASPSPGMLTFVQNGPLSVSERDGTAAVQVMRTAGHDGAVSVMFGTGVLFSNDHGASGLYAYDAAMPDEDYLAVSGQFDWAEGEETEREIAVTILDDTAPESVERFLIGIYNPQGGVMVLQDDTYPYFSASVEATIIDDEAGPPPNPTPSDSPPGNTVSSTGTGGGSLSWETLLVLSGLLFARLQIRTGTCGPPGKSIACPATPSFSWVRPCSGRPLASYRASYCLVLPGFDDFLSQLRFDETGEETLGYSAGRISRMIRSTRYRCFAVNHPGNSGDRTV